MDAGGWCWWLIEEFEGAGEVVVGVLREEEGDGESGDGLLDEHGASLSFFGFGRVFGVGEECEFGGLGVLHAGYAGDVEVFVAYESTVEALGNVSEFHFPYRLALMMWGKLLGSLVIVNAQFGAEPE